MEPSHNKTIYLVVEYDEDRGAYQAVVACETLAIAESRKERADRLIPYLKHRILTINYVEDR